MIKFKASVRIKVYSPAVHHMLAVLFVLDDRNVGLPGELDLPGELVVTSINDGRHKAGSRHGTDEGVDVRSWNFATRAAKRAFREEYEDGLNAEVAFLMRGKFRVLYESTLRDADGKVTRTEHFHAQVKKGETL